MDLNLFEHSLIAAAIQTFIGILTGRWWVGGALPSCYFIGRELAQAEYRWIEELGTGQRVDMPWHAAFDPRVWQNADQVADCLGPAILSLTIALIAPRIAVGRHRPALDHTPRRP